jgi:hypothetical protein
MLIQLLYISKHNGTTINNLDNFMAANRTRNKANNLTSILLSTDKYYLHLLEGTRISVNALYNRISRDEKHYDCTILRYIEIKSREFDQWSAEHVSMNDFISDGFNLLFPRGEIHIDTLSATQAVTIIRRIHAHLLVKAEISR